MTTCFLAGAIRSKWFGFACCILLGALITGLFYEKLFTDDTRHSQLNMSCFAYRDVNRNGIYDSDDRPYAGLKITMDRPRGAQVVSRSNLAGFTNFTMRHGDDDSDIYYPGDHTITVEPPEDWIVTTGNDVQTATFRQLEEAPVGMVANRTYQHVGIAPKLTISGSVKINPTDGENPIDNFVAISPNGVTSQIQLDESGTFTFEASPGPWTLELATESGRSTTRMLTVTGYPVVISRIDPGRVPRPKLPHLRRIGFDDLTPSDTLYEVPSGYSGLNWNNWVAAHQKLYKRVSHINATVSSEYFAYNSSGHPAVIWSDSAIDFVGVFVSVTSPQGEDHDLIIKAWRDGDLAYEDRLRPNMEGPMYFAADYRGVTKIEFSNPAYWHAAIDDFEYRTD